MYTRPSGTKSSRCTTTGTIRRGSRRGTNLRARPSIGQVGHPPPPPTKLALFLVAEKQICPKIFFAHKKVLLRTNVACGMLL